MKNIFLIAVCLLTIFSCSKKDEENISNYNNNKISTITYTTNGKTYTASDNGSLVLAVIRQSGSATNINIGVQETSYSNPPFAFSFHDLQGSANLATGVGKYTVDLYLTPYVLENLSQDVYGKQTEYKIIRGTIDVSVANSEVIKGSYSFDLQNDHTNKTVTGIFTFY